MEPEQQPAAKQTSGAARLYEQTDNVTVRRVNFCLESLRQCNYADWMTLSKLIAYCSHELAAQHAQPVQCEMEQRDESTPEVPRIFYDVRARLPPDCWISGQHHAALGALAMDRLLGVWHHQSVEAQCAMLTLTLASTLNPWVPKRITVTQIEIEVQEPLPLRPRSLTQLTRAGPGDADDRAVIKRPRTGPANK